MQKNVLILFSGTTYENSHFELYARARARGLVNGFQWVNEIHKFHKKTNEFMRSPHPLLFCAEFYSTYFIGTVKLIHARTIKAIP